MPLNKNFFTLFADKSDIVVIMVPIHALEFWNLIVHVRSTNDFPIERNHSAILR